MESETKSIQVLIANQYEPMQNVIAQILKSTRVSLAPIVVATSLEQMQSVCKNISFNAVVSDMAIEDVKGLKLLDALEQSFPGMRLLFVCEFKGWESELAEVDKRGHCFIGRTDFLEDAQNLAKAYLSVRQQTDFVATNKPLTPTLSPPEQGS